MFVGISVLLFTGICLCAYCLMALRAAFFFRKIPAAESLDEDCLPRITLLAAVRNERPCLERLFASWMAQDYPADRMECICINDHSDDGSAELLNEWTTAAAGRRVVHLKTAFGKKAAITAGVQAAKGDIILQTDADCWMGPQWARRMAGAMTSHASALVSAPVLLESEKPHFFSRLQQLEYLGLMALGAGSMQAGAANMANGANLAYRRSAFLEVNGYAGFDHFASGDDEMLLQKILRAGKQVVFLKDRDAAVYTRVAMRWRDFRNQRIRWVSKARHYALRSVNAVQLVSYIGFWFFPVAIVNGIAGGSWAWLFTGLAIKILSDLPLMSQAALAMKRLYLLRWLPLLQVVYIPYVLWIGLAGNFSKTYNWKGRWVK